MKKRGADKYIPSSCTAKQNTRKASSVFCEREETSGCGISFSKCAMYIKTGGILRPRVHALYAIMKGKSFT